MFHTMNMPWPLDPADFTPVCTTELGATSKLKDEFAGRNFHGLLPVIESLRLTEYHSVATPANWKQGVDAVILPSLQDPDLIQQQRPQGYMAVTPYLRLTPQPKRKD